MSTRTEWVSLETGFGGVDIIAPGEYEDVYGNTNDLHALVVYADNVCVIEAHPDTLRRLAHRILADLDQIEKNQ